MSTDYSKELKQSSKCYRVFELPIYLLNHIFQSLKSSQQSILSKLILYAKHTAHLHYQPVPWKISQKINQRAISIAKQTEFQKLVDMPESSSHQIYSSMTSTWKVPFLVWLETVTGGGYVQLELCQTQ